MNASRSALLALAFLAPGAVAQDGLAPGVTREMMWPAPTAADWKRPCLVTWQRTWDDALAVARETKKPILVCVNMDGEIASEHYAGVRYRQPDIAALYGPYVTVIASVYRHNPRDHDEEGRRILCPRFGSVTCGEHIAIEPLLYEQFMDGKRIAPRHIGVELEKNGAEMYDVYYAWDTATIFTALRDGVADRPPPLPIVRDDHPILERVGGRDIEDRTAVELAYARGTREQRRALIESALVHRELDQVDLLRLALFGLDVELAKLARRALAQCTTEGAIDLVAEALRVPMDPAERDALIAALVRLGETFPRARTVAAVYQGLAARSSAVDVESWSKALGEPGSQVVAYERSAIESRLERQDAASAARPDDPGARLELAESFLALAADPRTGRRYARVLSEDAQRAALAAEKLGASGWRVHAAIALAARNLGDLPQAHARAEAAMSSGLPPMPERDTNGRERDPHGPERGSDGAAASGPQDWSAMSVLALFAESRRQAISKAVREKTTWPPQWLTDVHAAYSVLARHPLGTEMHVVLHHDFLKQLGATGQAARVLDDGLERFPDAWILHDRLRGRILAEKGVNGLEAAYEARLAQADAPANLESFAGLASLVAAEFHRRQGRDPDALAAYDRGIAHYDSWIAKKLEARATADHYVALALAGRARIAYERQDDERALAEILASFERRPDAAASLDGLNISPVDTAKMLRARLVTAKRDDLAARLQAALDRLDPELLRLPAYERDLPSAGPGEGRPPRRRPGAQDR